MRKWLRVPFWDRIDKRGNDECWPWLGGTISSGYGALGGRLAHRLAYEKAVGQIAPGMTIDHLCFNKLCCNPAHLDQVTRGVNASRGIVNRKNTWCGGNGMQRRTHCKHGHEFTPENTRVREGTRVCIACQRRRNEARRAA